MELRQCVFVLHDGVVLLIRQWHEWVRLADLTLKLQVVSIMLWKEGAYFNALIGLEEVKLVELGALEVTSRHMVLVVITQLQDALVRLE